jgi:hypothetical protein
MRFRGRQREMRSIQSREDKEPIREREREAQIEREIYIDR